ncbi:MAG: hypothetical protein ACYC35_06495 [Pirellulales bacterium]
MTSFSQGVLVVFLAQALALASPVQAESRAGGSRVADGPLLVIESLTGPVTPNEINAFKTFMAAQTPPRTPWDFRHNAWSFGPGGRGLEALGMIYEASGDTAILNQMIRWTDECISQRNDLMPAEKGGQRVMWTGKIDKVWCPEAPAARNAKYAGCETEDAIAHIAYCAKLILQHPALWKTAVPDGDPRGYGATYLTRAKGYLARCDEANDDYFLKWFVEPGTNLIRSPANQPAWKAINNNVDAINRQMMFAGGYQRLAECHEILGDDPARVKQYDAVVKASVAECLAAMKNYAPREIGGRKVYDWPYFPWSKKGSESVGHAAYDVLGIHRASLRPAYGVSRANVTPLADTVVCVISKGNHAFAATVDGKGRTSNYLLGEWIVAADWNPAVYDLVAGAAVASGRFKKNAHLTAYVLWMKHRRATAAEEKPVAAARAPVAPALAMVSTAAEKPAAAAPDFGPNVLVFDPSMTDIQSRIDAVFAKQERSQFGPDRYAYLLKPGKYDLDVQVGFYMHVVGLGRLPDDVAITGAVRSKANWMSNRNATCNFWRAVENLSVTPTRDGNVNIWAVSQATAMRRVHVRGDMNLWDGGWSSGGFLADSKIDGRINSGSQQQWLSRNTDWGRWIGGNWNMVFVGAANPPAGTWPQPPYTVIDNTPVVREKPYLVIDEGGNYQVMVPSLRTGARGTTWSAGATAGTPIPIDRFYLAHPGTDSAQSINAALAAGKNLLLTPGVYRLESSIRVTRPGTIVFGLGYPTLVPERGTSALEIADVDGVTLCGVLVEAGPANSATLVQVGPPGSAASHAKDPTFLHDVFCRAGGAAAGKATCLLTINSSDVVGDNFWLWRADHGRGAGWNSNPNATGLVVNGKDVTIYGLFVEHCQEYQTVWNGEGGRVYFYQSEMPYDPPSQAAWQHGAVNGYASYKVADSVTRHEAWGLGVYCVFYAAPVVADNAIETPTAPGVKMHHMVTIRLGGRPESGIKHIINGTGDPVISAKKAIVD